jgi:exonuclease VII large subunit
MNIPNYELAALNNLKEIWKSTLTNVPPTFHKDPDERKLQEANQALNSIKEMISQQGYRADNKCQKISAMVTPIFSEISTALKKVVEAEKDSRKLAFKTNLEKEKQQQQAELEQSNKRDEERRIETQRQLEEERLKIENENKRLKDLKSKRIGG